MHTVLDMKFRLILLSLLCAAAPLAALEIDAESFIASLGGSKALKGKATVYDLSGASYRTYLPEVSPSPDGGLFISVRIDHMRGFLASDDHASLEMTFSADGTLAAAQSSIALQGITISSDLIKGGASASTSVAAPYVDRAVKIGTDLVADLSSKLLREKIVEPGRVSFPAAIRHNYNLLYQSVKKQAAVADEKKPQEPAKPAPTPEVKPYQPVTPPSLRLQPRSEAQSKQLG